ncbi:putative pyruvate, phosphate dikinase regulatory protein [Rhodospirillaceae bacterium LM-1]|nr:putative pyruvate, phosphate dikinase regulatory protein [Rhodospirillaceae bacterium LM-1]
MKNFHLHLVSDATGETVTSVARACLVQFESIQSTLHQWWLVRSEGQVDRALQGISHHPGIVLYTLVDPVISERLATGCRALGLPCIGILNPVLAGLEDYLHHEMDKPSPGRQHVLDDEYFKRIDAMHYTIAHDDGQLMAGLEKADVILLGVSRTSKTPTCMYLANRGVKAANVPLVPGMPLPDEVLQAKQAMIVGLTREPSSLSDIRKNRLRLLDHDEESDYADEEKVREEVLSARRLFAAHGWPVIDVTRRSIEEASASILQLLAKRRGEAA